MQNFTIQVISNLEFMFHSVYKKGQMGGVVGRELIGDLYKILFF